MKKIRLLLVGLVFCSLLILTSCRKTIKGTGETITKTYVISDVTALDVYDLNLKQGIAELNIHAGLEKKVVISAQENILNKISCRKDKEELKISAGKMERYDTSKISIDIYGYVFNEIDLATVKGNVSTGCISTGKVEIDLSGAANMKFSSIICSDLEADLSGASAVEIELLTCTNADFDISGASTVTVRGVCETSDLDASGASDINAVGLVTKVVKVDASGASTIKTTFTESLKGSASGASTVSYIGPEDKASVSCSGASKIVKN